MRPLVSNEIINWNMRGFADSSGKVGERKKIERVLLLFGSAAAGSSKWLFPPMKTSVKQIKRGNKTGLTLEGA